ncbi:DUF2642 domain-containing protein [Alicyclobacillus fastidiosus]|uniref:DUF2642 domain-containing protein n=1 Tax=Alicyclobacillus fastidiosus TaxID=392011 RepID=A0ABV5AI81_9BACL
MALSRLPDNTASGPVQEGVGNVNINAAGIGNIGGGSLLDTIEGLFPVRPEGPANLRQALLRLLNQNVVITTQFESITGTLIRVERDYVVIVETTSNVVLIPIRKIESVTAA